MAAKNSLKKAAAKKLEKKLNKPKPTPRPKPKKPKNVGPITVPNRPGPRPNYVPGTPGSPGVLKPPTDPFLTPDEMDQETQTELSDAQQRADLDYQLEQLRINSDYEKQQIDKQAGVSSQSTVDDMIRRGLFRSSIKDADLADIESARTIRKKFLDDQFDSLFLKTGSQKKLLDAAMDRFKSAMNRRAVENAQNATGDDPYLTPPTEATPGHFVPLPKNKRIVEPGAGQQRPRQIRATQPRRPGVGTKPRKPNARVSPVGPRKRRDTLR